MSYLVGPILASGPRADAVVGAIRESHPDVVVVSHGSYVRVGVTGRCAVTRESLTRHAGAPFALPRDLEAIMPSFSGELRITEERVEWVARGESP
jgi:hypothetical protein